MSEAVLRAQRSRWQEKAQLRVVYEDYFRQMAAALVPGPILEVGSGSGNLRSHVQDVITTDITPTPWIDAVADAQALPFANESFANIVGLDVLHHVARPRRFFVEAERVLRTGGRIILVEPAITPVSGFFYRRFHPEPVLMDADPLADGPPDPARKAFDANGAIPTLLWGPFRQRFADTFPRLRTISVRELSLFAYPLSGGFRSWTLLPVAGIKALLKLESVLPATLFRFAAFRLLAIIEKTSGGSRLPTSVPDASRMAYGP